MGILAPQSFVTLTNEENVWIGMIPGRTGTVMPFGQLNFEILGDRRNGYLLLSVSYTKTKIGPHRRKVG